MHRSSKFLVSVIGAAVALWIQTPTAQAACEPLKQIGSIALHKRGGLWDIPVGINGTPKYMLLDTGLGATAFSPEVVEELHLPLRATRNATMVSTSGERSYGATYVERLALGTAGQFSNSDYMVEPPLPGGAKRPASAPAGYIGLELLSHFDFDMDLNNGVLNLFSLDHCDGQVVYWKTDAAVAIPFEWDAKGRIRFRSKLDGTNLWAVLSTRDTDDTLNLNLYRSKTGFDENAPDVERLADTSDGGKWYRARFKSLDLGGIALQNPLMLVREDKLKNVVTAQATLGSNIRDTDMSREPDIAIGVSTMAKLHVYVASKERKLYISPAPQ